MTPGGRTVELMLVTLALGLLLCQPAAAHEPLWGETPTVFGFGIFHPEVKTHYRDAGSARNGGERQQTFEQEYMLQYAPRPSLNLVLEIPFVQNTMESRVNGRLSRATLSGLGDIHLYAKSRVSAKQEVGFQIQQTVLYGLKLPTGESHHRDQFGERAHPHDQPGTGKLGLLLGYAADRETLEDTVWGSVIWTRDLGGGFRMGDMVDASIAYGRWLIRPNEARELGLNLAFGLHGEWHADDSIGGGRRADNGHHVVGVHLTPIITKGTYQYRLGVLVPVARGGKASHADFPVEVRLAVETFF
jgi:hypothetical protein